MVYCRSMARLTNEQLGKKIGVGPSMASRIRSGKRLPSTKVCHAIQEEFGIEWLDLMDAHRAGPVAFGECFRRHVDDPAERAAA